MTKARFVFADLEVPSDDTREIFAGMIQAFSRAMTSPVRLAEEGATAPAMVPIAQIAAAPVRTPKVKTHKVKTHKVAARPAPQAETEAPSDFGPTTAKVVDFLRKHGPLTTMDIIKGLPDLKDGVVYPTLSALRKKGIVRNSPIQDKIGSFNFLVEAKS